MTLERAIEILNERKHDFHSVAPHHTIEWVIEKHGQEQFAQLIRYITEYKHKEGSRGEREYEAFTEFEAIAIAEKYERDAANAESAEATG